MTEKYKKLYRVTSIQQKQVGVWRDIHKLLRKTPTSLLKEKEKGYVNSKSSK